MVVEHGHQACPAGLLTDARNHYETADVKTGFCAEAFCTHPPRLTREVELTRRMVYFRRRSTCCSVPMGTQENAVLKTTTPSSTTAHTPPPTSLQPPGPAWKAITRTCKTSPAPLVKRSAGGIQPRKRMAEPARRWN